MHAFRCAACGAINRLPERRPPGAPSCGRCKQPLELSGAPQEVDAESLERALGSSPVPVLVDFWAPWCGPCRQAAPVLERIARERAGRLLVLKLNTEDFPGPAQRFGVSGIPTFLIARSGRELARQTGLPPPAQLARWVEAALAQEREMPSPGASPRS